MSEAYGRLVARNVVTSDGGAYEFATAAASGDGGLGEMKATAHNDGQRDDTEYELISMLHQLLGTPPELSNDIQDFLKTQRFL